MCRFVAYQGHPVSLADLLYRPRHSLVSQSVHAEQMSQPFNGDGFGIGWYVEPQRLNPFPCVFRTATPAWASRNLEALAQVTTTERAFAHVRAASPGMAVQETNSHPFHHGRFLFMHNGQVRSFRRIRRRLQQALSDWAWESIEGGTDSEHAFALLLDEVGEPEAELTTAELRAALVRVIARLHALCREVGASDAMALNFALTDGRSTVVTRYAHGFPQGPSSLHYSAGRRYSCEGEDGVMAEPGTTDARVVIVASEPLTRHPEDWTAVPVNHTLAIHPDLRIEAEPIAI